MNQPLPNAGEPNIDARLQASTDSVSADMRLESTVALNRADMIAARPLADWELQTTAELPSADRPEKQIIIEGYRVLRVLGRGGMGVVYLAWQPSLERLVAIKMLLAGEHAGTEELVRFQTEAKAIAGLKHPNIVQIHEVREHEGLPYFSLEYVRGGSLSRRIAGRPQQAREAAQLLQTIALAVEEAHNHGVVHRDLKPANILLDFPKHSGTIPIDAEPLSAAVPKINDFGLAKRLEFDSQQTRTGVVMGSPSYMAPEQARGDIKHVGPLADVYALGAILYEMLTGRPPFLAASTIDTIGQVIHLEPVAPSRLEPKVPRDLETICLKCLQKEPSKRYRSAAALAADLGHFLQGEPIEARPVTSLERAWRWSRRNPKLALASGASMILLVLVTGISVWSANTLAKKNLAIESEKQIAMRQATENLITIQNVIEDINKGLAEVPGTQDVRVRILKLAEARIKSAADAVDKSTSRDATDLSSRRALGIIYEQIGNTAKSYEYLTKAVELARERVIVKNYSDASRMNLAMLLQDLGRAAQEFRRDMQLALQHYEEARAVRRDVLDHPFAGDGKDADPSNVKDLLSEDHARVATTYFRLGDPARALTHYQSSLELRRELAESKPSPEMQQHLIRSRLSVAEMKNRMGDTAAAREAYTDAIAQREALLANAAEKDRAKFQHELARTHGNFGEFCVANHELDAAQTHFERCRELVQELADADGKLVSYQRDLGLAWYRLGSLALRSQRPDDAQKSFAESLRIRQALADRDPDNDRRQMELMLALAHGGQHRLAAAIADKFRKSPSPDNEMLIDVARCYAQCFLAAAGDPSLQLTYRDTALDTLKRIVEQRYRDGVYLRYEPDFDPLRELAEFKELVEKISSTPAASA